MSTYADGAEMLLVQLSELPGEWMIWLPESFQLWAYLTAKPRYSTSYTSD